MDQPDNNVTRFDIVVVVLTNLEVMCSLSPVHTLKHRLAGSAYQLKVNTSHICLVVQVSGLGQSQPSKSQQRWFLSILTFYKQNIFDIVLLN